MKYFTRLGVYKASNVQFNPSTMVATSYDWWIFVKKIGDYVVFNEYSYSNTTRKHQSKVRNLLRELGIEVDMFIEAPRGLQSLDSAEEHHTRQSEMYSAKSKTARSRKQVYLDLATQHSAQAMVCANLRRIERENARRELKLVAGGAV